MDMDIDWVEPPQPGQVYPDGWIRSCWDDTLATPSALNAFLARWPPSRTPAYYAPWIAIRRIPWNTSTGAQPNADPSTQGDIAGLVETFQSLVQTGTPITTELLDTISSNHSVKSGKWMVFCDPSSIDTTWADIARMVCFTRRRGQAKVSPRSVDAGGKPLDEDTHVICVYVDDYTDEEEVMKLRQDLRDVGIGWTLSFKPDSYTHLGIYSGNPWKVQPSRYYA